MRKLKLQVQMSVDGFVAGPNGELDWMVFDWVDELKNYVTEVTEPVDTILLGRKMAGGFISHWASVAADPEDPEVWAGKKFTDTPKVVFSKTLERSEWPNTEIANGELVDEVNQLKNSEGKDIIVSGGGGFNTSLIKAGLIDEYHLFTNPVALGHGMTIFGGVEPRQDLVLMNSKQFACGIVVNRYDLKKAE